MLSPSTGQNPHGPTPTLHKGGDGPSAHGTEPVQGTPHGAAGGCAVDGNDQSIQGTPICPGKEEIHYLAVL